MKVRNVELPERRIPGSGRRESDPKVTQETHSETTSPPPPKETKPEVEPNRRHFLHRKIGGKKAA